MRKLGISIYPENANVDAIKTYITKAAKYGFSRIFTCLISLDETLIAQFKEITHHATALGMEVIADVDPNVFKHFNIDYRDLSFFKTLHLSGIRLDLGFSGYEEAEMTYNPHGLKIELNMSAGTKYVDNILTYIPNKEQLIGCHNFYPHKYSGISRAHFMKCSEQFKTLGLRTAAFVSSSSAEFGPWPVSEGLCTLEEHRELSIVTQAKDLFNTNLIDDVIIANMFASDDELKALGNLDPYCLSLQVSFVPNVPDLERTIVLEEPHFNRGDVSDYMIRSTQSRVKYKGCGFAPFNTPSIQKGDILIESDLYTRYAGELQLALRAMENSGRTNVVAKVIPDEVYLLDQIRPWQKFKFNQSED